VSFFFTRKTWPNLPRPTLSPIAKSSTDSGGEEEEEEEEEEGTVGNVGRGCSSDTGSTSCSEEESKILETVAEDDGAEEVDSREEEGTEGRDGVEEEEGHASSGAKDAIAGLSHQRLLFFCELFARVD